MKAIIIPDRQLFERLRHCPNCGRRLSYLQYDSNGNHIFEKRCSGMVTLDQADLKKHFWFIHTQPIFKRTREGKLTNGAKKALRDK